MKKSLTAPLFYLGTFLSSAGSLTFNLCLVAFMLGAGFPLFQVSLILGLQRFVPVLVMGIWGHATDRLNPRMTVIVLEVAAALSSFALLILWKGAETNYLSFLVVCVVRSVMSNFQTGSRGKIAKLLADGSYGSNAKHAIWQMKSTQGATLFAGIAGLFLIKFLTMKAAIVVDLVTFAINGVFMLAIQLEADERTVPMSSPSWRQKFHDLFKYNSQAATLDIMLAISIAGLMSFIARVSDGNPIWNAAFMTSYGLAVWAAGFLERSYAKNFSSVPFWIVLGGSYLFIGSSHGPSVWILGFMFLKDMSYWVILHRISGHIQADTPTRLVGAISSARFSIMVVILSVGEILVGAWAPSVSLLAESILRSSVALGVGFFLLNRSTLKIKTIVNERPAL
jgi:hypothetical protein